MRTGSESTPATGGEFQEFVVSGGCAVCDGPVTVRATPGALRGVCRPCGWISHPLVWQRDGRVAVGYPPLASA